MNRRLLAATAIVLALGGAIGAGAQTQKQSSRTNWWQAERTFHLNQIRARARAFHNDTLIRVQIGTLAAIDAQAAAAAVMRMEEMIKVDAAWTPPLAPNATTRTKLAELLNQLEMTEVRFDNGIASIREVADVYLAVVRLLVGDRAAAF